MEIIQKIGIALGVFLLVVIACALLLGVMYGGGLLFMALGLSAMTSLLITVGIFLFIFILVAVFNAY